MFEINFNKLMQDLVSDNFETQCLALESFCDLVDAITQQAIKGFEVSKTPDLIAERLANLGTIVTNRVEGFIESSKSGERKILASILLLHIGSHKGLDDVIAEFKNQGKYEHLSISKLVKTQMPGVGDLIIERLRKFSLNEFKDEKKSVYVNNLLQYLENLSVHLPTDLKESFEKIRDSPAYKYYALPD